MKTKALTAALIFLAATTTLARADVMNFSLSGTVTGFQAFVEDTTPEAFSFTAKTDVEPNTVVQADEVVTVVGLGDGVMVPISVSGDGNPAFRINAGSGFGALETSGMVKNGDLVQFSLMTAAAAWETTYSGTLTIGTVSRSFSVTTKAEQVVPPNLLSWTMTNGKRPIPAEYGTYYGYCNGNSWCGGAYGSLSLTNGYGRQIVTMITNVTNKGSTIIGMSGDAATNNAVIAGKTLNCNNGAFIGTVRNGSYESSVGLTRYDITAFASTMSLGQNIVCTIY